MDQIDYYEILEIDKEASAQNIKESYRRLAFQYHPDRNDGDTQAVERMKAINEAYAVLSDPEKRARYDGLRQSYGYSAYDRFRQSYTEEDIFRGSDIGQIFEEMARSFGFRGFEDVFRASYGQGFRTFEVGKPGFAARGFIFSGPLFGGGERREMQPISGAFPGLFGKLLKFALKKMTGVEFPEAGKDRYDVMVVSARLADEGGKVTYRDKVRSRQLLVTIPPGIRNGQTIRLKGVGRQGKNGGIPGDLYLRVEIQRPVLQRIRNLFKP
ncbi:MAG TPA: DnaJ domain-containing protein [Syntrophorhabdaceae bacterium]|nr:DnaJ domain-containing protein [Syntrophorhabdaceae bacterium]